MPPPKPRLPKTEDEGPARGLHLLARGQLLPYRFQVIAIGHLHVVRISLDQDNFQVGEATHYVRRVVALKIFARRSQIGGFQLRAPKDLWSLDPHSSLNRFQVATTDQPVAMRKSRYRSSKLGGCREEPLYHGRAGIGSGPVVDPDQCSRR